MITCTVQSWNIPNISGISEDEMWDGITCGEEHGAHSHIVRNNVLRDSYGYTTKSVLWLSFPNRLQKRVYKNVKFMYYETMVEPSHTIPFSPNVNVNLIRGLYNWAGLSKTTGAERTKATYHSFRSREQSAQCSVSTLHCADSSSALNKMKMVVVRNSFARNDNGHVVSIHRTKHFLAKQ